MRIELNADLMDVLERNAIERYMNVLPICLVMEEALDEIPSILESGEQYRERALSFSPIPPRDRAFERVFRAGLPESAMCGVKL